MESSISMITPTVISEEEWKAKGFYEEKDRDNFDRLEFYNSESGEENVAVYCYFPVNVYIMDAYEYEGKSCFYIFMQKQEEKQDTREKWRWIGVDLSEIDLVIESKFMIFGEQYEKGERVLLLGCTFYEGGCNLQNVSMI